MIHRKDLSCKLTLEIHLTLNNVANIFTRSLGQLRYQK